MTVVSLIKLHRRIEWSLLRLYMVRNIRLLTLLEKFVAREFIPHVCVKKVTMALYYHPGYGLGESTDDNPTLYWEAPLALTIWSRDDKPMAGLAVEFRRNALCIRQLQGVAGIRFPPDASDWPRKFVKACISFARWTGIKHVRVYRADQSLFYWLPVGAIPKGVTIAEYEDKHRTRMRRRYDGTARQIGMEMRDRWGEWTHPKYKK
jgi:hypothetical protein